jgi:hypothetical protein
VVITKDTDEQIVLRQTAGRRIFWGCVGGFGGGFIVATGVLGAGEVIWAGIALICGGLVLVLGALCLSAHFKQITFDQPPGSITVGTGVRPLPCRSRHISKAEVESVDVQFIRASGEGPPPPFGYPNRWDVSVRVAGKNVHLHTDDKENNVTYLANRIAGAFAGLPARAPRFPGTS